VTGSAADKVSKFMLADHREEAIDKLLQCRTAARDRPGHNSLVAASVETGQIEADREAA
jgi:hypothetical protein